MLTLYLWLRRLFVVRETAPVASEIAEALRSVAGALCMCAVSPIAKGFDDQIHLAAAAMDACSNGFDSVDVTEEASKRLIDYIRGCKHK